MNQSKNVLSASAIFLLMVLSSCSSTQKGVPTVLNSDTTHLDFTVAEAPEWTSLFYRNSGWVGADGIFSIPLNKFGTSEGSDSTLLLFSDTMVGEIEDGKFHSKGGAVNNTVAYIEGKEPEERNIQFYFNEKENGEGTSYFIPNTPHAQKGDYYWLGDGFVNHELNNNLYIFAYRMRNSVSPDEWGFKQDGNIIIRLKPGSKLPFKDQEQIETPFIIHGETEMETSSLGAGIYDNTKKAGAPAPDGYIYVYGVQGKAKNLIVSRVKPKDFENFDKWRFLNGKSWVKGIENAAYITQNVSNELSVTPLPDGRYALVFQVNGMGSVVGLRLGLTPYGPFGPVIKVWNCQEAKQKNYFAYNAKAHPALSKKGELLISYNVNAFDFSNEIKKNPHLYRPRFIKLKLMP